MSKMHSSILMLYAKEIYGLIGLAIICIVIWSILRKIYYGKKEIVEKIVFISGTILCIFLMCFVGFWAKDALMDLPTLISGDFHYVDGIVLTNDTSGRLNERNERVVRILDQETKDVIQLRVLDYYTYKGEQVKAYYLPNTQLGALIR